MIEGVDASYDWPTVAELVAAGKHFGIGYVSTPGHAKNLTPDRARALQAAGLGVAVVGEITAGRALAGYAQGVADMRSWVAQVSDLDGPPDGGVIRMAIDFDVLGTTARPATALGRDLAAALADVPAEARAGDPEALEALGALGRWISNAHAQVVASQMDAVLAYQRGGASVVGMARTGPYGERDVCTAAADAGFGQLWQTYAWSRGEWEPRAQLRQYRNGVRLGSGLVDLDRAMTGDYGQWQRQQEDTMALIFDNLDQFKAAVRAAVGLKQGEEAASSTDVATLLRGDATHPDNLDAIHADTRAILQAVNAAADPELVASLVAGKLEITGIQTDTGGVVTVTFGPKPSA